LFHVVINFKGLFYAIISGLTPYYSNN